jgi:CTP synthase (UTP-ammonia lyase)
VAGLKDAGHTESDPNAAIPLLILATCPVENRPEGTPRLWGKLNLRISPGSLAFRIYHSLTAEEPFTCNYELNPAYRGLLEKTGLTVTAVSEDGGARIVELADHRFFLATGFVPQLISEEARPHPLILAYLEAAMA